jgi:predicted aspartyl protease
MENIDMGRVVTEATIANIHDLLEAHLGKLPAEQIRKFTVPDALVDSGATSLGLPKQFIDQLGLTKRYEKRAMTAGGVRMVNVYAPVQVEIMGRLATVDPIEVPDGSPVLIGQMPLEMMDWVIDIRAKKLIGNPAHGGEQMLEMLALAVDVCSCPKTSASIHDFSEELA